MEHGEFLDTVAEQANLTAREEASAATHATLETLCERIGGGEVQNLTTQLPNELESAMRYDSGAEAFDMEEFLDLVRERENGDVSDDDTAMHVQAATSTVSNAVSGAVLEGVAKQLPAEYDSLFRGRNVGEEPST